MPKPTQKSGVYIFVAVCFFELCAIVFLASVVWKRMTPVFSINPIREEEIDVKKSSGLNYFYEPKPNMNIEVRQPWLTGPVRYTINADSLNERFNYTLAKGEKTYRIIALGDSFTFGLYVNTKENWPELLEDELNRHTCGSVRKFEVINLGVYGYDIEYSIERYRLRGQKYRPDMVLWFFNDSDVNNRSEKNEEYKALYLSEIRSGKLQRSVGILNRLANDRIMKETTDQQRRTYAVDLFSRFRKLYAGPLVTFSLVNDDELKNHVLNRVVQQDGGVRYYHDFDTGYTSTQTPGFSLYPNDIHPSKKGHAEIMRLLFEKLKSDKAVPCL